MVWRHFWKAGCSSGFVRKSAACSSEGMYLIWITDFAVSSRMKWCFTSICLLRFVVSLFLIILIAPWLSIKSSVGFENAKPNFLYSCWSQSICLAASAAGTYSASHVDKEIVCWSRKIKLHWDLTNPMSKNLRRWNECLQYLTIIKLTTQLSRILNYTEQNQKQSADFKSNTDNKSFLFKEHLDGLFECDKIIGYILSWFNEPSFPKIKCDKIHAPVEAVQGAELSTIKQFHLSLIFGN